MAKKRAADVKIGDRVSDGRYPDGLRVAEIDVDEVERAFVLRFADGTSDAFGADDDVLMWEPKADAALNQRPVGRQNAAELGLNPKDLIGSTKVDLALVPPAGIIACALAMTDGALKYDPYNWRAEGRPVQARTYVSAALRHLYSWLDGEELSADAGVHHLGHAMACCAILLDAMSCDQLVDNRPRKGATPELLTEGVAAVKRLIAAAEARKAGGG